jgi:glycosyltransferase involved in cell wall biosynthesis
MNIIFLTISRITDINQRGIYTDLMRKFRDEGHNVTIVNPVERKFKLPTKLIEQDGIRLLNVKTLNVQKTNVVEKGLGIILLEYQFIKAINRHLGTEKFDLILYSTPPITVTKIIGKLKKANPKAITYLLLKDIFPQNAVDLEMFSKNSIIYKFFRAKEKKLYKLSDYIGCMSPANVEYVISHNPEVNPTKVEVCPNSIELQIDSNLKSRDSLSKYQVPENRTLFIYGGNLGKPQGIDFLLKIIESNKNNDKAFFMIVGSGTEYKKVEAWIAGNNPTNARLIPGLPKQEYDQLVRACDVGLIFLDPRFTIPNYPSRLLSYMEYKMPVLAATDKCTDVGKLAQENGYGYWCENGNLEEFNKYVRQFCNNENLISEMGKKGYEHLLANYTVDKSCEIIMKNLNS